MNNILDVNKFVPKGWGSETWLINTELYCNKTLYVHANKLCSFHYHPIKNETFYLQEGEILVIGTQDLHNKFILSAIQEFINTPETHRGGVADLMQERLLDCEASAFKLLPGDIINIGQYTAHIFFAYCNSSILEMSTMHSDEDVVRLLKGD